MNRKRFLAPVFAALLVLPSAAVVTASEPTEVGLFGCSVAGGTREVVAGTDVVLGSGWGATNKGLVQAFIHGGGTFNLTVNGEPVDLGDWTSGPYLGGDGFWWVTFGFHAGTLDAGESIDAHLEIVLEHVLYDGFSLYQPGTLTADCLVVAA